jgi:hypothetical protein
MGYLQETCACIRSADEAKFLEEWLLKAIEKNDIETLRFCKDTLYKRYIEQINNAEGYAEVSTKVVSVFEEI